MQIPLFESAQAPYNLNLLPKDGGAYYYPEIFDQVSSDQLFGKLIQSLDWQPEQIYLFGKKVTTQRKVVWVGDENCLYAYSGMKKRPQPWTPELLSIKTQMEEMAQWKFNSCLLNLYHSGSEGMGWHSDNEDELDSAAPIASLSLGATRKFAFKHKLDKSVCSLFLENGSVLIMHSPSQKFWNHSLLKTKTPLPARINLTFRAINPNHELPK
jgi:alkylated DNA repair dioxygenase AlkB